VIATPFLVLALSNIYIMILRALLTLHVSLHKCPRATIHDLEADPDCAGRICRIKTLTEPICSRRQMHFSPETNGNNHKNYHKTPGSKSRAMHDRIEGIEARGGIHICIFREEGDRRTFGTESWHVFRFPLPSPHFPSPFLPAAALFSICVVFLLPFFLFRHFHLCRDAACSRSESDSVAFPWGCDRDRPKDSRPPGLLIRITNGKRQWVKRS